VRNAGHMVPADQKEAAFIMAHNFIFDIPFPDE
jgi:serine carboxypeptidase-like clade 2